MLVLHAHGKGIEARILGLNGEGERTHPLRFLARRDGGHPDGMGQRRESESAQVLRQTHLSGLDLVEATLVLFCLDFRLVKRRRVIFPLGNGVGGGGKDSCMCAS